MATTLFVGMPRERAAAGCEAGALALKTRSIPPAEAMRRSLDALRWLETRITSVRVVENRWVFTVAS